MTRLKQRPVALAASAVLAAGAVTGSGVFFAGPAVAEAPAAGEQAVRFEVDFLTGMIDHHQMAVMMAQMCEEKAIHEELATMCTSIVASQTAQIGQMQTWLQDWYGVDHEPEVTGMGSMNRLAALTGEDFEVAFMRSMIRHHWGAIREAEKCFDNAEHDDLLRLCEEIYTTQLMEIDQMQSWLEQWYGAPEGRPVKTA